MALGVLFLLDNFGVLYAGDVFRYWPLLLIGLGLTRLLAPGRREDYVGGVVLLFLGSAFLLRALHVPWFRLRLIWPGLLVVLGATLIWQALRGKRGGAASWFPGHSEQKEASGAAGGTSSDPGPLGAKQPDSANVLQEFALMGGGERVVRSQDFAGGEVTAIMGGFEIDLRAAGMTGDTATVEVFTVFGGVEFKVPPDWNVVANGTPILGMFTDSTKRMADGVKPSKTLILRGTAIMGGVEVKN